MKLLHLNYSSLTHIEGGFFCKLIWRSLAALKVPFFVWGAAHKNILTCDNLQKKGKVMVNR